MEELVGKAYDGGTWTVTGADIEAYADATDDANPAYRGPDAVASPMFHVVPLIHLMLTCARDPELEIDMLRLVHGEHDMRFHHVIRPGDVLTRSATLASIARKSSGTVYTFRMVLDREGEVVVEGTTSYFVRAVDPPPRKGPRPDKPAVPEPDAVHLQQTTEDQAQRYAAASGDDNPIHTDEATAKAAGLPSCILHGLCSMALAQRDLVDSVCEGDPRRLASLSVRFAGLVFPGDALTMRVWHREDGVHFDTLGGRGKPALAGGRAEVRA